MMRPEQGAPTARLRTPEEALIDEARRRYLMDAVFHARVYAAAQAFAAAAGPGRSSEERERLTLAVSVALLMFPPTEKEEPRNG